MDMTTDNKEPQAAPPRQEARSAGRFAELLDLTGQKFVLRQGRLWSVYHHMVQPHGPASRDYSLPEPEARAVLQQLGAHLIRWGNGFSGVSSGEWYALVCDEFPEMGSFKSNHRQKLKKGLSQCRVERIDAATVARQGYQVYQAAYQRYRNGRPSITGQQQFYQKHIVHQGFDDIIHYWGVYRDNHLAAFAVNFVYDEEECNIFNIYFSPQYLRFHPSEALYYTMSAFYLAGSGRVRYINAGLRNILHDTNVQVFLKKKFCYRPRPFGLSLIYSPCCGLVMRASYPFRGLLGKVSSRLNAMYIQESIRRADRLALAKAAGT